MKYMCVQLPKCTDQTTAENQIRNICYVRSEFAIYCANTYIIIVHLFFMVTNDNIYMYNKNNPVSNIIPNT